jgi:carbonic anhydrase/acetyltransferase-like protein (isoleucine patch superfamily)
VLYSFQDFSPEIAPTAWVAEQALCIGRLSIGEFSSIWFNCVLRGDINAIRIGDYSNIQDGSILHVGDHFPITIGDYVTVGHGARLHGCTVGDNTLIGIGATILNGAKVGENSIIAAGSLIPEGMEMEGTKLYMGVPARPIRKLTAQEVEQNQYWAKKYVTVSRLYKEGGLHEKH